MAKNLDLQQKIRGFYAILNLLPSDSVNPMERTAQLLAGGSQVLQLRMKGATATQVLTVAEIIRPLCLQQGALLVINDRLDVALACKADGVHLGQDDLPLRDAKRLVGRNRTTRWIGISTHSLLQAEQAVHEGADYIGFGPCFPTRSKDQPDPQVALEDLRRVCQLGLPVVAIGGITPENIAQIVACGAAAAASIESVYRAANVTAQVLQIGAAWT